jgi:acyl-ACP thioesterase
MFEMVGRPSEGRTFAGSRRVRLGDCSPGGRLRLDATARYLQDLSDDDTRDAGLDQMTWVVRRTVIDVHQFPTYLEPLEMITWCAGLGSRWAERRVDITSAAGGSISSATLWVHLDASTLRPTPPAPGKNDNFAPSTGGRAVSSRLTLDSPPDDGLELTPWPTRFADFDVMDHVNNAVAFVVVEEVLARRRDLRAPLRVEVEYRSSVDRDVTLSLGGVDRSCDGGGGGDGGGGDGGGGDGGAGHDGWLVDDQSRCPIAFRITRRPTE